MTEETEVHQDAEAQKEVAKEIEQRSGGAIARVHVATPAYDGKVDADFASSMLMAGQVCTLNMIEVSTAIIGNGAFIEIARNILVNNFLRDDEAQRFTHFMFVDADLQFEPRAIAGLVSSNLPFTAGAYRRRQEPEDYPVKWTPMKGTGEGPDNPPRLDMNDAGYLKCERVPTGFMCLRRDVLETMTHAAIDEGRVVNLPERQNVPWLFYTKVDDDGRFVGEDYAFCDDYMRLFEAGVFDEPIWVWPDFDFVHGGYPCNYFKFLQKKISAERRGKGKRRLGKRRKK